MSIIDIKGEQNGMPFDKKRITGLIITVAIFLICLVIPMKGVEASNANLILATVMFVIVAQITGFLSIGQVIFPMIFIWCVTGCASFGDIMANAGTASLLMMLGFFIVAMGANKTNFSKRLAYLLLSKLGRSPSLIILALCLATALLSSFLSNLATVIMMGAIAYDLLGEVDEQPGKSQFGKCLMICIGVYACIGGMMLLNGSPSTNVFATAAILSATGIEVTYAKWAMIAFPSGLASLIPVWVIYVKWFKVNKSMGDKTIDMQYFKNKLADLGPMDGAEIRWVLYVAGMIACLLFTKFPSPAIALLFGALTIFPAVGVVNKDECMKELPWEVLMGGLMFPVMGGLISSSGVGAWMMNSLLGWAKGFNYVVLITIATIVVWIINSILVNSQSAIITVSTVALCAMASEMGLNPILFVMPTVLVYSLRHVLGMQLDLFVIHGYGYWEQKDTVVPGILSSIPWMACIIVGCMILVPLAGL